MRANVPVAFAHACLLACECRHFLCSRAPEANPVADRTPRPGHLLPLDERHTPRLHSPPARVQVAALDLRPRSFARSGLPEGSRGIARTMSRARGAAYAG